MYNSVPKFQWKASRRWMLLLSAFPSLLMCSGAYSQVPDHKSMVNIISARKIIDGSDGGPADVGQPPVQPPVQPPAPGSVVNEVTIYEDPNFGGKSRGLPLGTYRFLDKQSEAVCNWPNPTGDMLRQCAAIRSSNSKNFNDIISSIKVPTGLGVNIYEHADEGGGYGISVDLLEDVTALSKYDFDNKISYVEVFSLPIRPGFVWMRGSMRDGQFMPAHWERARANGATPANSIAVVSPPLPPHIPVNTAQTVIQVDDSLSIISSLGMQSHGDAIRWNYAETNLMGVVGSDFRGVEEIGSAAFERDSNNILIPDFINFWYPQKELRDHRDVVYFKRTLSGAIGGNVEGESSEPTIINIEGTYEDHDFNLDILPAPDYMYIITNGHKPELSTIQSLKLRKENIRFHNPGGGFNDPCTQPFKAVEVEIDMAVNAKSALNFLTRQRIGKQIAVYGPWIYDVGHCHQPEIHPAEQLWWSESVGNDRKYNLNLFCDSSQRFWWRGDMDDGTKLKPWGAPPIKGTFAIAFEVEIGKPGKKFEVSNIEASNVATTPNTDKVYNLNYQNKTLVSFVPHSNSLKVSYENVGLKEGTTNIVRGFLVLETTVGTVTQMRTQVNVPNPNPRFPGTILTFPEGTDPNTIDERYEKDIFRKVAGHHMFSVLRTNL
jgi:hypothetical protein